jgi:hypothetical protein
MSESKKRGRKKKEESVREAITIQSEEQDTNKKRGRKPKGGKLIQNIEPVENTMVAPVNVILHLKCSLKDLEMPETTMVLDPLAYNPAVPPEIMSYEEGTNFSSYSAEAEPQRAYTEVLCKKCSQPTSEDAIKESTEVVVEDDSVSLKSVHQKLRKLRTQFYKNTLNDIPSRIEDAQNSHGRTSGTLNDKLCKKSACFWCTYDFDNEPCFIPKYEMDDSIAGYGCFCRPECAVGYLMNEPMNDSTKFERYQLLNQIYSKVYGFKKNIKPAPSPYYLLDKFYGSLTIQEYRRLLKTEHMLLVLDKPMTRILPELHEDNDEFILNIYGGVKTNQGVSSGQFKVKRQSEKGQGPTKSSIMKEKFGMV